MAAANLVTSQVAKRYEALPIAFVGERALLVAMSDPANVHAVDDIAILTGYEIRVAVTTSEDIANVIARLSRVGDVVRDGGDDESGAEDRDAAIVELHETADDAPVVKLVHQLVGQAVEAGRLRPAHHPRGPGSARPLPHRRRAARRDERSRGGWRPASSRA